MSESEFVCVVVGVNEVKFSNLGVTRSFLIALGRRVVFVVSAAIC